MPLLPDQPQMLQHSGGSRGGGGGGYRGCGDGGGYGGGGYGGRHRRSRSPSHGERTDRDRDRSRRRDRDRDGALGHGHHAQRDARGSGYQKRPRTVAAAAPVAALVTIESLRPGQGALLGLRVREAYMREFSKAPTQGSCGRDNIYPREWLETALETALEASAAAAGATTTQIKSAASQLAAAAAGTAKYRARDGDPTKYYRCTDEACVAACDTYTTNGRAWNPPGGWQPENNFAKNRVKKNANLIKCKTCVTRGVAPIAGSLRKPTQQDIDEYNQKPGSATKRCEICQRAKPFMPYFWHSSSRKCRECSANASKQTLKCKFCQETKLLTEFPKQFRAEPIGPCCSDPDCQSDYRSEMKDTKRRPREVEKLKQQSALHRAEAEAAREQKQQEMERAKEASLKAKEADDARRVETIKAQEQAEKAQQLEGEVALAKISERRAQTKAVEEEKARQKVTDTHIPYIYIY